MSPADSEDPSSQRFRRAAVRMLGGGPGPDPELLTALSARADAADQRLAETGRSIELLNSQTASARYQAERMTNRIGELTGEVDELKAAIGRWNPAVIERSELANDLDRSLTKLSERVNDLVETIHSIHERTNQTFTGLHHLSAVLQDQTALQRRLERIEDALAIESE